MTVNYQVARTVLDRLEAVEDDLKPEGVGIDFHNVSDVDAERIVQVFDDFDWTPARSGTTEWVRGERGGVEITVFLASPPSEVPSRALDVIKAAVRGATT